MNLIKKHLRFQLTLLAGLVLTTIFFATHARAAITIDNFNSSQLNACNLGFIPIYKTSIPNLPAAGFESGHPHNITCGLANLQFGLGGEHDYINTAGASNSWGTPSAIRVAAPGLDQVFTLNVVGDESVMRFVYDGIDNSPTVNSYGLSGVNFTNDNVLRLRVSTSNNDSMLDVNFYKNVDDYSSYSVTMPNSDNAYQYLDIPLSVFEEVENITGTGVDLSDVKSLEFIFTNVATTAGPEDSDVLLADVVQDPTIATLLCNVVGQAQCLERHFGIGVDHIEVTKQLTYTISAEVLNDVNGDGDIDSAALEENSDTFRYTVTITNTDDLLDASVNGLVYSASFDPDYAYFLEGSVTTSMGSVSLGNGEGHSSVEVSIPSLADGETVTITYDMQVEQGSQDLPSITYSHHGTIDSADWDAYDTSSVSVLINRFDLASTIAYVVDGGGGDGDEYPGPGETVNVTVQIQNVGPNTSSNIAVMLDPIVRGDLVAASQSTIGTGSLSCGGSTTAINNASLVTYGTITPTETDTVTFKFTVEQPFDFGSYATSEVSVEVSGLCDQFSVFSFPYPLIIEVDAFPDHPEAHVDADADGLPDEWDEDCDEPCQSESELTLDTNLNDTDNDGVTNDLDTDDDGDGVDDENDAFPYDPDASTDTDGDGMPDDCANDCANSPLTTDTDDDNDGVPDVDDAFPLNCTAAVDTDGDGLTDALLNPKPVGCNSPNVLVDNDDDNDGVQDTVDKFPLNAAAAFDNDNDGMPDSWNASCNLTCQTNSGLILDPSPNDTDNDGVINSIDAFDNDCEASVDTDGDLLPDQFHDPLPAGCVNDENLSEDPDDDNDGVADEIDAFPLNNAASVDDDQDGLPDAWNDGCNESCQADSGLTLDTHLNDTDNNDIPNDSENPEADDDGDGIPNGEEEEGMELIDNNPPVVTAPADIEVTATGSTTTVSLGRATATDIVQGIVVDIKTDGAVQRKPFPDKSNKFKVGKHIVTWTAIDAAGNVATDTQKVIVLPQPADGGNTNKSKSGGGGSLGLFALFAFAMLTLKRKKAYRA